MNDKRKRSSVPAPNVPELIAERNWTALAGLALIALGALYALQHLFGLRLELWALLLVGIGGWLLYTAWQPNDLSAQDTSHSVHTPLRTRAIVGAVLLSVGVMSIFSFNWWGLMVLGAGGWLAYDTRKRVDELGGVWTRDLRNRMFVAALLGYFGLSAFVPLGGLWWVVLLVGGVVLYRRART